MFLERLVLLMFFFSLHLIPINAQNLSEHQWKNRILIIQFDHAEQENYLEQIQLLKDHQQGLKERKLVVYQVCDDLYKMNLKKDSSWDKVDGNFFEKISQEKETNFSIHLIGLDGGTKLHKSKVLTMKELFAIIDRMPMRRQEMRNSTKQK